MGRNIPVNLIEIIENLFLVVFACIKCGNSWSTEFAIEFGVRQGSVLFATYLDDLAALCKPKRKLLIVLYTDDILLLQLLAPTLIALQKLCPNHPMGN